MKRRKLDAIGKVEGFENVAGHGLRAVVDGKRVLVGNARFLADEKADLAPVTEGVDRLIWASVYNLLAIPVAAGVFYPLWGWSLRPEVSARETATGSRPRLLQRRGASRYLALPPGNRLEKLKGDLAGFYSIRVNEQFRIVFRFDAGNATDAQITDHH